MTADPMRMMIGSGINQQNSDGGDMCAPMSLSADNKISLITDAAPGEVDEMSFKYINSVWSYWFDFQWSSAQLAGANLSSTRLCPSVMETTVTIASRLVSTIPACAVLSKMFGLYRGGFDVKINVVKTGYHSGVLAFVYVPGKRIITPPAYADTSYLYRTIIDIQKVSEIILRVPYILPQSYVDVTEQIGTFLIYVVNPLLAPATVSSTVDVMLQIRGSPDLQYQCPDLVSLQPIVPQGGDVMGDTDVIKELGEKGFDVEPVHHAQQSIGEYVCSLLQLAKAHSRCGSNIAGSFSSPSYAFQTHRYFGARYNGTTWVNGPFCGGDIVSFIASMYAFSRGSMRYRLTYNSATTGSIQPCSRVTLGLTPTFEYTASALNPFIVIPTGGGASHVARVATQPFSNGGLGFQVPFYSKFRYMLNRIVIDDTQVNFNDPYLPTTAVGLSHAGQNASMHRAVGDDFQFSFFLGVPAYTINYATAS